MDELIAHWNRYRDGLADVDDYTFLGLFTSGLNQDELRLVLEGFPFAEEIHRRLMSVLNAGSQGNYVYLQQTRSGSEQEIVEAAVAWLKERERFCRLRGQEEFASIASGAKVRIVSEEEFDAAWMGDQPESWISELIGDEVIDAESGVPAVHGLSEGLYGIAADYYLASYVIQPLIDLPIDFSLYFELWRLGGKSVLTRDELLVRAVGDRA